MIMEMKMVILIVILSVTNIFASNTYSQTAKVSLNLENKTLEQVMDEIEQQSEFYFIFNQKQIDVNRVLNIHVEEKSIKDVLPDLFNGTDVKYAVLDRKILLTTDPFSDDLAGLITEDDIQDNVVKGTVSDALTGEPMPGVNILVKGTTVGVLTDISGKYSINVTDSNAVLSFSFIGYLTQEVAVSGRSSIDVAMNQSVEALDEVVVIGYGTTVQKRDLTGAVASIQGSVVSERKTTQVSQALQGSIPGLMVTRSNNAPGSTATIRVRGITSIGASNPLIIVDGVPVEDINSLNPNDIENISVLKDAASASIYGSRAAAGVILITTKRAKSGQLSLEYNMEFGFEKPTELPENVDVLRYLQIVNELRWNDNNNNANEYPLYPKDLVDNYLSLNAQNPDLYPNTNWADIILRDNAPRQSHLINITAGTNSIKSRASIGYDKTDGLFMNKSYERFTTRFNNDIFINKFLSATIDLNFRRVTSRAPVQDPMWWSWAAAPVYAAEWSDGRVGEGKTGENIYASLKYGGYNNGWTNQAGGRISLDFLPVETLKISAIVSPNLQFYKGKLFNKKVEYYDAENPALLLGTIGGHENTNLYENRNDSYNITIQLLANYKKMFGDHNLNAMAGYEDYYAFYEYMGASRQQYELSSFPYLNLGPLEFRDNSGSAVENAYHSFFGRVIYDYKNKYLFQGNIRFDGSSRFHQDYRWGTFPSVSVGWVISEESFLKDNPVLSYLKLRGSLGSLGNEQIGYYPYQSTIAFANSLFYQGTNIVSSQTAAQIKYVIEDISWETTATFDIGADAIFFDNRLRFTGDYYIKKTRDMLLALEIPDYLGFDNPDQNTGRMNTKGWELELGWNDDAGGLNYSVAFNISDSRSIMGNLGGTQFLGDQIKIEGSEFNEWYGYLSDGLYQSQEEVNTLPKISSAVKPGDVKYLDISGPAGVPDGKISPDYDRTLLGGSLPRFLYGGNIRLDYKNFDLGIVVQGVAKQNARLSGVMVQPIANNWGHIPKIIDGNYYSHYKSAEENRKAKYPRMSWSNLGTNYAMSDYWLFNGSYFRMKNITLGYNLPSSFTQKINMQGLRVYGSISDLFSINKYPVGWDPEVAASGYPITTSFILGISVKF